MPELLDRARSLFLLIDVQERLLPAMAAPEAVRERLDVFLRGAEVLGIPTLASEQYSKGLGPTVTSLRSRLRDRDIFEKTSFSCLGCSPLAERLESAERPQVVLGGIETHVCVLQSALELRARDMDVFVLADGTGARTPRNHRLAIARMRQAGCQIISVEMALFEGLRCASSKEFKEISAVIK